MNNSSQDRPPRKGKALLVSGVWAVIGAAVGGLLGSGLFHAVTGSGVPNVGGAVGSIIGAFGAGYLSLRAVPRHRAPRD